MRGKKIKQHLFQEPKPVTVMTFSPQYTYISVDERLYDAGIGIMNGML